MEFEIINKQINAIYEDLDILNDCVTAKEVSISGNLADVNEYLNALNNIKGHVNLLKMAFDRLENPDEP